MSDSIISDFDPTDPLLGVDFTRTEVEQAIEECLGVIRDPEAAVDHVGSFASTLTTTLELLPIVAQADAEIPYDPEATEQFVSERAREVADRIKQLPKDARGSDRIIHRLGALTRTPIKDARERAEAEASQAEKQQEINALKEQIRQEELRYAVTARQRRQQTYKVDGKDRNGTWLVQKTTEIADDGSQMQIFRQEEADLIGGIALGKLDETTIAMVRQSMHLLTKLHNAIERRGGSVTERGLLSGLTTLKELFESDEVSKIKAGDVSPLYRLAEKLYRVTVAEEQEVEVIDTLDEGPFSDCEVVPIAPFEARSIDSSTAIIDDALVTEENILDDIQIAVNRSRGNYIIKPERIRDFIALRQEFIDQYGQDNITIFRTLRPKWSPLPWYVIQIRKQGDTEQPHIAVLETPIHGNATYMINDKQESWLTLIEFSREDVRGLGAKSERHVPSSPISHNQKISTHVRKGMR